VVVQGLGNVGYHAAKFCQEEGCLIVGLAEYDGAIFNSKGLNVDAVMQHWKESGSIRNYPGAITLGENAAALELACDILIPAALEHQITQENAPHMQAKIVAEAASGPTTAAAEEILLQRNVLVIPDIYLNAGGVTVSYFEWVQDLQNFFWTEDEVNKKLRDILTRAFHEVLDMSQKQKVDMRLAALMIGINRVARAMLWRGLYA
jgi:glutamate dehydrogenase/leucine dehydrogenase